MSVFPLDKGHFITGMYQTKDGRYINADINGALNILRKSNVVSLTGLYTRGEVDTPTRIRIA